MTMIICLVLKVYPNKTFQNVEETLILPIQIMKTWTFREKTFHGRWPASRVRMIDEDSDDLHVRRGLSQGGSGAMWCMVRV